MFDVSSPWLLEIRCTSWLFCLPSRTLTSVWAPILRKSWIWNVLLGPTLEWLCGWLSDKCPQDEVLLYHIYVAWNPCSSYIGVYIIYVCTILDVGEIKQGNADILQVSFECKGAIQGMIWCEPATGSKGRSCGRLCAVSNGWALRTSPTLFTSLLFLLLYWLLFSAFSFCLKIRMAKFWLLNFLWVRLRTLK